MGFCKGACARPNTRQHFFIKAYLFFCKYFEYVSLCYRKLCYLAFIVKNLIHALKECVDFQEPLSAKLSKVSNQEFAAIIAAICDLANKILSRVLPQVFH